MFSSLFYRPSTETQIIPISKTVQNPSNTKSFGFFLGAGSTGNIIPKVGFDDILYWIKQPKSISEYFILINTMPPIDQDFLIRSTVSYQVEESRINEILDDFRKDLNQYTIIVYGRNSVDDTVDKKYHQLIKLGFRNVYVYYGGMFEWIMLQDVFGEDYFPVDAIGGVKKDPLHFVPIARFK